jgi:uncharacterized protein
MISLGVAFNQFLSITREQSVASCVPATFGSFSIVATNFPPTTAGVQRGDSVMPIALSYPGVYVEEIPSGVRTIVGVSTSIAAFIGRTLSGNVDEPTTIHGTGDFDRIFGGLGVGYALPQAVHDFFQNGGGEAIIVRLYQEDPAAPGKAFVRFPVGNLSFVAVNQGTWAQALRVSATKITGSTDFNLTIRDTRPGGRTEVLKSVSTDPNSRRRLDRVLEAESDLLRFDGARPAGGPGFGAGDTITDGATKAELAIDALEKALNAKSGAAATTVLGQAAAARAVDAAARARSDADVNNKAAAVAQNAANDSKTKADKDQSDKAAKQKQADSDLTDATKKLDAAAKDLDTATTAKQKAQAEFDAATAAGDAVAVAAARKKLDAAIAYFDQKKTDNDTAQATKVTATTAKKKADDDLANANATQAGSAVLKAAADDAKTRAAATFDAADKAKTRADADKTAADGLVAAANTALSSAKRDRDAARAKLTTIFQNWGGSDGVALTKADTFTPTGAQADKKGLYALENTDLFNLLCIPPYDATGDGDVEVSLLIEAATYCVKRRAMLLVDPPSGWTSKENAAADFPDTYPGIVGPDARNAATYFPRLLRPDPLRDNQVFALVPCGAMAGIFARTDVTRGVWKAPAGQDATLSGITGPAVKLTDPEHGELNPLGLNCVRKFPLVGNVVWGARTTRGSDIVTDEYKYIPVRRTALFIEESLFRGLKWVVFEPNDEPLWSQIRLNAGAFMQDLFRQGAFQGRTPLDAYFVKCDSETTTQSDIDRGVVNIRVGFAPLKPAEFVIIQLQQITGQNQAGA